MELKILWILDFEYGGTHKHVHLYAVHHIQSLFSSVIILTVTISLPQNCPTFMIRQICSIYLKRDKSFKDISNILMNNYRCIEFLQFKLLSIEFKLSPYYLQNTKYFDTRGIHVNHCQINYWFIMQ